MVALFVYLKQPNCIYCTYLWLATLAVVNPKDILHTSVKGLRRDFLAGQGNAKTSILASEPYEVAALGRPLFPGMLYDSRKDSFIPGVTLWDKTSLSENLDTHPQPLTSLKFSSSDSLSSKSNLLDVGVSLKASFMGGLVEVGGSAKYLRDTKSSNQQSRVTMYYSETSRFEQLTMTQLGNITYPQVFDQKTATHVVTAVLYGAHAFMVFDRTFSEEENRQEIEGELNIMVKKIPQFSIEGKGSVNLTEKEKGMAENIACTFHGDVRLEQNPTTYMEALDLYKKLPTLLKENPQNMVPVNIWLYPLHLLDTRAAQLEREISTGLISNAEDTMEELGEVERICNDLSGNTLVNAFSDIKQRLHSFQSSFRTYKSVLLKEVGKVLPAIRGGGMEDKSLEDVLKIHRMSPFNAVMLNQWLQEAKSELQLLASTTKMLEGIKIEDSDNLNTILLDLDIDVIVCLTFTSLKYEDPYLLTLQEYLNSHTFKGPDGEEKIRKWFNDPDTVIKMRENISLFRGFLEANKNEKKFRFIISAISDPSNPGSSIYLYKKGKLTDKQFQPVSKPPPPIVKNILDQTVSLKLQKSPTGETVQYRVEYKQITAYSGAEEQWSVIITADADFTLTGLESGKPYLIRYRAVSKEGVSEASDTVSPIPSSGQPVIVGGKEDGEVTFMTSSISTIKKISIYQDLMAAIFGFSWDIIGIEVSFNTGQVIKVGAATAVTESTFLFDDNDKIVSATLWPEKDNSKICGLEFEVVKSDGTRKTLSYKCINPGSPVSIDVRSGKCYGITARSGSSLNALGFYFI